MRKSALMSDILVLTKEEVNKMTSGYCALYGVRVIQVERGSNQGEYIVEVEEVQVKDAD